MESCLSGWLPFISICNQCKRKIKEQIIRVRACKWITTTCFPPLKGAQWSLLVPFKVTFLSFSFTMQRLYKTPQKKKSCKLSSVWNHIILGPCSFSNDSNSRVCQQTIHSWMEDSPGTFGDAAFVSVSHLECGTAPTSVSHRKRVSWESSVL